jgi:hypothetical protein
VASACRDNTGPKEPADAIKIAVGELRTLDLGAGGTFHVSGRGAGAEYTLIGSYAPKDVNALISLQVSAADAATPAGPPNPTRLPLGGALQAYRAEVSAASTFDRKLRTLEREQLTRYFRPARAAYAARRNSIRAAIDPPAIGSEMQLNVSLDACDAANLHLARVTATSDHIILVEDEANPSGGFSADDYTSIAQELETLVYPVLTQNFAEPSDMDANGRVIVFFTRAVNELSPDPASGFVSSFFYLRDLLPKGGDSPCAGSNQSELIYMLAPDPNGEINGYPHATAAVRKLVGGNVAHSGQYLINAAQRLYVTQADLEDVWLDEAMSAIAEELVFYRAAGLGPKQNLTFAALSASSTVQDAFNTYQVENISRLLSYLTEPESHSPLFDDGTLGSRGALWQFLRYVADQSSVGEPALWRSLVSSSQTGVSNLEASARVNVRGFVHEWALAQYDDDARIPAGAVMQHPSWNFRDLFTGLTTDRSFPLAVHVLEADVPISLTLHSGGATYVRFGAPAGKWLTLQLATGTTQTSDLSLVLLRTR